MRTFMFSWNGRRKFVDASTQVEAERKFMERFGFWPEDVEIEEA